MKIFPTACKTRANRCFQLNQMLGEMLYVLFPTIAVATILLARGQKSAHSGHPAFSRVVGQPNTWFFNLNSPKQSLVTSLNRPSPVIASAEKPWFEWQVTPTEAGFQLRKALDFRTN